VIGLLCDGKGCRASYRPKGAALNRTVAVCAMSPAGLAVLLRNLAIERGGWSRFTTNGVGRDLCPSCAGIAARRADEGGAP
jgi:hypothetical protein